MCVFISRIPVCSKSGPLYTVISKKVSSWSLLSCVNLIVGCIEFILDVYLFSWVSVPVQMMKISSIYRFHILIRSGASLISFGSKEPMKMLAYAGVF